MRPLTLTDPPAGAATAAEKVEADISLIRKRLADNSVPEAEEYQIQDLLRYLARCGHPAT
ncbi:hypothetical protein ACVCAH_36600 [Micromonospora sp. LZ34]